MSIRIDGELSCNEDGVMALRRVVPGGVYASPAWTVTMHFTEYEVWASTMGELRARVLDRAEEWASRLPFHGDERPAFLTDDRAEEYRALVAEFFTDHLKPYAAGGPLAPV